MKKNFQRVLTATLICGACAFTSCTSDKEDNPTPESTKNRKEFVKHTRANLKEVAMNLNFTTWKSVNYFNKYFNQDVLLNSEFDKTLSRTFGQEIQKTLEAAPAEITEKTGKKYRAIVDIADFNYTFTASGLGFDVQPNNDEGLVMVFEKPSEPEKAVKISIKGSGKTYSQRNRGLSNDSVAVFIDFAQHYDIALSTKQNGQWVQNITGDGDLTIIQGERPENIPEQATSIFRDSWNLSGNVATSIPGDATALRYNIGQNTSSNKAGLSFDYTHNGKKMIGIKAVLTNSIEGRPMPMTERTNMSSIIDLASAVMYGKSIDNLELTLLDDLTTTLKVSDCQAVLSLQDEMAHARRNYADQQTIENYVSQLNGLVTASMTCKSINQQIPMRLVTNKLGVDWWAVPALNFSDEKGYVPLTEMLDKESMEYCINIIDHAVEPMQESMTIVRQLFQALQKLQGSYMVTKPLDTPLEEVPGQIVIE